MRTFNFVYIGIFTILYSQSDPIIIQSYSSTIVTKSLDSLIHDEIDLTIKYDLHQIRTSENKTEYKKSYKKKYLDTLIMRSDTPINQIVMHQITKSLLKTSIGTDFDKKIKNLHRGYYFLQNPIQYRIGRISKDRLGGVFQIDPVFENQFSGLMGMGKSGKIWDLTGEFNLHLENILRTAGSYDFYWKSVDSLSQILKFELIEPHPFGIDFGVKWKYHHELIQGLYTIMKNQSRLMLFLPQFQNRLSLGLNSGRTMPTEKGRIDGYSSESFQSFNITLEYDDTDHRILPNRGYKYELQLDGGKQKSTSYFESSYNIFFYIPILDQYLLMFSSMGESISFNKGQIPKVRLFYYGGASTLRGFREQQFFASKYNILTFEFSYSQSFRWRSNIFIDYATSDYDLFQNGKFGYGLGFTQVNKQNIFKIEYAIPGSLGFQNAKLHIKWISRL